MEKNRKLQKITTTFARYAKKNIKAIQDETKTKTYARKWKKARKKLVK